jgi:hypothetical protein
VCSRECAWVVLKNESSSAEHVLFHVVRPVQGPDVEVKHFLVDGAELACQPDDVVARKAPLVGGEKLEAGHRPGHFGLHPHHTATRNQKSAENSTRRCIII